MSVFDDIYTDNLWNGGESRSGPGSSRHTTRAIVQALDLIQAGIGFKSVLDVGCGDGLWMPDLPHYRGVDVSPVALELARANHPHRTYSTFDGEHLGSRHFDLAICRDVIQHVPLSTALALLAEMSRVAEWLLVSTYIGTANVDIAEGGFYSPDLTAPPFDFRPAVLYVFDGWDYDDGSTVRDETKFLGLWRKIGY